MNTQPRLDQYSINTLSADEWMCRSNYAGAVCFQGWFSHAAGLAVGEGSTRSSSIKVLIERRCRPRLHVHLFVFIMSAADQDHDHLQPQHWHYRREERCTCFKTTDILMNILTYVLACCNYEWIVWLWLFSWITIIRLCSLNFLIMFYHPKEGNYIVVILCYILNNYLHKCYHLSSYP